MLYIGNAFIELVKRAVPICGWILAVTLPFVGIAVTVGWLLASCEP